MTTTVLDREMYAETRAARLLGVPVRTLHYWLEGGRIAGKTYRPVIRVESTGSKHVTWAEFVEAGLLREYRRDHRVPMRELRLFIDALRERYGVPYPLAHATPFVSGRELVSRVQEEVQLDTDFALVAEVRNQYILAPAAESFFGRVTWHDNVAARWRPDDRAKSPVVIDPEVRFGDPAVHGISTAIIWELIDGGEEEHDVAELYGLSLRDVRAAVAYESLQGDAAA